MVTQHSMEKRVAAAGYLMSHCRDISPLTGQQGASCQVVLSTDGEYPIRSFTYMYTVVRQLLRRRQHPAWRTTLDATMEAHCYIPLLRLPGNARVYTGHL